MGLEMDLGIRGGLTLGKGKAELIGLNHVLFSFRITNQLQDFHCVTIGLTNTFDAASCNTPYRWICEKRAK